MSALAATLAGVFVFTGTSSVIDALSSPRILIYAVFGAPPGARIANFYPYIYGLHARPAAHSVFVRAQLESVSARSRRPGYVLRFA